MTTLHRCVGPTAAPRLLQCAEAMTVSSSTGSSSSSSKVHQQP